MFISFRLFLLSVFMLAVVAGNVGAEVQIPSNPTMKDCQDIWSELHAEVMASHARMNECMSHEPQFGRVKTCKGNDAISAWAQCESEDHKICEAQETRDRIVAECKSRAATNSTPADSTISAIEKVNDAYEKYENTRDLLTSPVDFFKQALGGKANADLQYLLHGGMESRDGAPSVSERVYRQTLEAAKSQLDGLSKSNKGGWLISEIQKTSLDMIDAHFMSHLNQMDRAFRDAEQLARATSKSFRSTPVAPAVGESTDTVDCAILQDTNKSRALMENDASAFLALVEQCKG